MESHGDNEPDGAICATCGQKLTLVASLRGIGDTPRRRLYECGPCQKVITIPPPD
jgi:DNA-directed RNA polymerase subunit RPC12/RpoP